MIRAWLRYRRRLSRLAAEHLDQGYRISPVVWEALREQARAGQVAGPGRVLPSVRGSREPVKRDWPPGADHCAGDRAAHPFPERFP